MTVAFLFPGQGSQSAGLLHHLPQHAEVARTIHEASVSWAMISTVSTLPKRCNRPPQSRQCC